MQPTGPVGPKAIVAGLVLVNLVPVIGVLFWEWHAAEVLILYWAETMIIGVLTLMELVIRGGLRGLGFGAFFLVHFGMFMFGHLAFLVLAFLLFQRVSAETLVDRVWPAWAFLWVSHLASFVYYKLMRGEGRGRPLQAIMVQPYPRIIVMHLVILLAALPTIVFGQPMLAVLLLIVLKIIADVHAHLRAHARSGVGMAREPNPAG